jgi:hypothetical protein
LDGDIYYNPVVDAFFVYSDGDWIDMPGASPDELGVIKRRFADLSSSLNVVMEAIEMSHEKGEDGKCRPRCSGCAVKERVETLATARRLME